MRRETVVGRRMTGEKWQYPVAVGSSVQWSVIKGLMTIFRKFD